MEEQDTLPLETHTRLHPLHLEESEEEKKAYLDAARKILNKPNITLVELLVNPKSLLIPSDSYEAFLVQRWFFFKSRSFYTEKARSKGMDSANLLESLSAQENLDDKNCKFLKEALLAFPLTLFVQNALNNQR